MKIKYVSIKNFDRYQRYTDRLPPWVKLYYEILDDPEFMRLDEVQQCRYMKLLLVASRCENRISTDQIYLQNMLRVRGEVDLTPLIHAGFLVTFGARTMKSHVTKPATVMSHLVHLETETEKSLKKDSSLDPDPKKDPRDRAPKKEQETETDYTSGDLKKRGSPAAQSAVSQTWACYERAYIRRYRTSPARNAMVNGQIANLVSRIGQADAPLLADFFLSHNDPFYVRKRHPVGLLLQDAEGLHTQWVTGVKATTGEAKNAEQQDESRAQIQRVDAMLKEGLR